MKRQQHDDLPLQTRDEVVVPTAEVFVTVPGEIDRPGVVCFHHGLTVSDYLLRAPFPTRDVDLRPVHFVDWIGPAATLHPAALDAPVSNCDILFVERQAILRLLEGIQCVILIVRLFNNNTTAINTVSDWIDPWKWTRSRPWGVCLWTTG